MSGPERLALVADPSQVEQLTEEESKCLAYLKDAFSVKVNNKDGNLKITLDLPDPKLSAYLKRRHSFDTDSRSPVFHFQTQGTLSGIFPW